MARQGSAGEPTRRRREGETGGNGNPRVARCSSRAHIGSPPSLWPAGSTSLAGLAPVRGGAFHAGKKMTEGRWIEIDGGQGLSRTPSLWASAQQNRRS